jgi:hypothetical protein
MWNDTDGMLHLRGAFDPVSGAVLQSRLQSTLEATFHSGTGGAAVSGTLDHRRIARHLVQICQWPQSDAWPVMRALFRWY